MLELFKHYNIKHFNTCRWKKSYFGNLLAYARNHMGFLFWVSPVVKEI